MNFARMLDAHRNSKAELTVACMEVKLHQARAFGVMSVDAGQRIRRFEEKPERPRSTPDNPGLALASMGIYLFSIDLLCEELERDSLDVGSGHDFGNDLLPRLIYRHRVFGYRFGLPEQNPQTSAHNHCESYWRDVGTIDAYHQASMDLLQVRSPLNLYSERWPIRKYETPAPPAKIDRDVNGVSGVVTDSMLSNGVVVSGGVVVNSILSSNVRIDSEAIVTDCVLFDGVRVGAGTELRKCIVDKEVQIPAGEAIGVNPVVDAQRFTISENGVVVIPKGYQFVANPASPAMVRTRASSNSGESADIDTRTATKQLIGDGRHQEAADS
jgi:glucose-1-phosphate adenylyltransferase